MHQYDTYIYEIYKERSISRAAEKLYIAQPSLSAVLKKVEKEKGFQIFDRSTIPLEPTECGRLYIESLERIMTIERTTYAAIYDILNLHTGTLNIGGTNLFISFVLPELFEKYHPLSEGDRQYDRGRDDRSGKNAGQRRDRSDAGQ